MSTINAIDFKQEIFTEAENLKIWYDYFDLQGKAAKKDSLFRDAFNKGGNILCEGFEEVRRANDTYEELIRQQICKQIKAQLDQTTNFTGKVNQLNRKPGQASNKQMEELKAKFNKFTTQRDKSLRQNMYLALNYKMDIHCKMFEANMAVLDKITDQNVDQTLKKLFG